MVNETSNLSCTLDHLCLYFRARNEEGTGNIKKGPIVPYTGLIR